MIRRWRARRDAQRRVASFGAMARAAERQGLWASAACFREAQALAFQSMADPTLGFTRQDG